MIDFAFLSVQGVQTTIQYQFIVTFWFFLLVHGSSLALTLRKSFQKSKQKISEVSNEQADLLLVKCQLRLIEEI